MTTYKLGDVCTLSKGKTITRATSIEGEIPVIGGGLGPTYYHNSANRQPPVITISASGANAGYVNYWETPIWASDCTTIVEKTNSPASLDYILKFLQSKQEFINTELRRGSAQPHVYPSDIAALDISVPSLEEQREIVEKINYAFAEIDLLEANLALSDENAAQLSLSLLSASFDQSEISSESSKPSANQKLPIAEKYEAIPLGELCDSISGLWTGKKAPFEKATVIRNTNFTKDCKLDLSNVAILDVESKQLKTRKLIPGDLIVEKSGGGPKQAVGRVVYFSENTGTYSLSNFTSALRVKNPNSVLPKYLQHFLYFQYVSGVTESMQSNSTGIRNLNIHQFLDIKVPLPTLEKQDEIVTKLDLAFVEIERIRNQIAVKRDFLVMLRQSLLSDSFSPNNEKVTA
jgi:restriction endonuclease S subunit